MLHSSVWHQFMEVNSYVSFVHDKGVVLTGMMANPIDGHYADAGA